MTAPSPLPTVAPPAATLPPLEAHELAANWTVIAIHDASGDTDNVSTSNRVRGGTYFDIVYACESDSSLSLSVIDTEVPADDPRHTLTRFGGPCSPQIRRFTGPTSDRDTTLSVVVESAGSGHFWAQLAVPSADVVP